MTYAIGGNEFRSAAEVYLGEDTPAWDSEAWYTTYFQPTIDAITEAAKNQPAALKQAMDVFIARAYAVAGPVRTGNLDQLSDLTETLRRMQKAILAWDDPPMSILDMIENVLRAIPKNLRNAVHFVAEELSYAVNTAVASSAGKWALGLGFAGLVGLYLWTR